MKGMQFAVFQSVWEKSSQCKTWWYDIQDIYISFNGGESFQTNCTSTQTECMTLWEFHSLDEIYTLVYIEVYILNRFLSLEESFILSIVEN